MADPISIVQSIGDLFVRIINLMGTFDNNQEDCGRIRTLVATAQTVVKPLKQTLKIMKNKGTSAALKGLEEALERSINVIESCKKKNAIRRGIQANDIAGGLRRVYEDILANMVLVDLTNGINNNSILADITKSLADLRARNSLLTKILEIIAAHPDVHLRQEVEKLVRTYRCSTEYASDQNKKERKTKKTDVASRSEVKNEKDNVPAADFKVPRASLSDGSAKSTLAKSVIGQGGCSIANKDSSHRSNPADGAGSSKKKENKIKEIDGRNTTGSKVKIEKTNVPADSKGSLSYAKCTSVKSVNGRGLPSIVNKIIQRSTEDMTSVTSIDVHPAKPWIVTGHEGGNVSIWDFQKQKIVMELQVNEEPGKTARRIHDIARYIKDKPASHWVCSVKFITQEKWLAVGDGGGYIHVYTYTDTKLSEVDKFRAHHGNSVNTLAVHPTEPYLLSSSAFGRTIRLWNWNKGWMNIQKYDVKPMYPHGVLSLKFNPRDTNTFACVTKDNRVKVGDITTSRLTTKLRGPFEADYFFTDSNRHLMATLSFTSPSSSEVENQIWDLETGKVVHTLAVSGHRRSCIAGHPTLPILVTALDDGTIRFWDASTYRLEKNITDSPAHDLALFTDTNGITDLALFTDINDITRLIVSFESMIAIVEVNLPRANSQIQADRLVVETMGDIP